MSRVRADFSPGGALAQRLENYEAREQQIEMAEAVEHALLHGEKLFVEAGTGTGKTLAYLLPAVRSGRRVLVSTATKTLQHQLMEKDIPLLRRVAGKVDAVLLKGRQNYLCLSAYDRFVAAPSFRSADEERTWRRLKPWAESTETGDRAELDDLPEDLPIWQRVTSTTDQCAGRDCKDYDRCFLFQTRERAATADIVVVNHHLFFADAAVRDRRDMRLLPETEGLIFDEGHHLEETASAFFTVHVSNRSLQAFIDDLRDQLFGKQAVLQVGIGAVPTQELEDRVNFLEEVGKAFFELVRVGMEELQSAPSGGRLTMRPAPALNLLDEEQRAELPTLQAHAGDALPEHADRVLEAIRAVSATLKEGGFTDAGARLRERIDTWADDLRSVLASKQDTHIHLVTVRRSTVALEAVPLDVRPIFWRHVFGTRGATVITSATLATDGNFRFLRSRLGAPESSLELALAAPFDYMKQAVFYVPTALPAPNAPNFVDSIASEIESLVRITDGRAFVLFTSYRNMRHAHKLLASQWPYKTYMQGEMSRGRLLDEFRRNERSVLFATASFWEGVDVPGDALSLVIIDKLPFANPSDPLISARARNVEATGGNAFRDYTVPQAIIQLKQGFGRLIRSKEDHGIVAILDNRLLSKSYGKRFLDSLPRARRTQDIELVERWWAHVRDTQ